jgi:chorismate synthase
LIENTDQRSRDYSKIKDVYRPGHADMAYDAKYGFRDYRGGGRASGRETAARVAGGAVAQTLLGQEGMRVLVYTVELGGISAQPLEVEAAQDRSFGSPDVNVIPLWEERVREVQSQGDSIGGVVEVRAAGVPAGLGEPVFDKLDARLAYALMSIGAVKAVEIGAGVLAARLTGGENNDQMTPRGFASNNAGGVLGGVSSGQEVIARIHVKPIPSIAREQQTVTSSGEPVALKVGGRHDVSAIPRINPVAKAMVALTLADFLLMQRRMLPDP